MSQNFRLGISCYFMLNRVTFNDFIQIFVLDFTENFNIIRKNLRHNSFL